MAKPVAHVADIYIQSPLYSTTYVIGCSHIEHARLDGFDQAYTLLTEVCLAHAIHVSSVNADYMLLTPGKAVLSLASTYNRRFRYSAVLAIPETPH